jgi:hypothetical protein
MRRILNHIGEPTEPPRIAPARDLPAWDNLLELLPNWDALAPPAPEYEFAQLISG